MTFAVRRHPRWYWAAPFGGGGGFEVTGISSFNPFIGPEAGAASNSAKVTGTRGLASYLYPADGDVDPVRQARSDAHTWGQQFTPPHSNIPFSGDIAPIFSRPVWTHDAFYFAANSTGYGDTIRGAIYKANRWLDGPVEPVALGFAFSPFSGETLHPYNIAAFPEQGYLIVQCYPKIPVDGDDPPASDQRVYLFRFNMDGTGRTPLYSYRYESEFHQLSASKTFADLWCGDRVGGFLYTLEYRTTYDGVNVDDQFLDIYQMSVETGTRTLIASDQTLPSGGTWGPTIAGHPTWDYLGNRLLVTFSEFTGEQADAPGEVPTITGTQGIKAISTAGTFTTLASYDAAYYDVPAASSDDWPFRSFYVRPVIAWTSALTGRLYENRAYESGGGAPGTNYDSPEVGIFQYDPGQPDAEAGLTAERLCGDPRQHNYQFSGFEGPYTVLGPGTRAGWEL